MVGHNSVLNHKSSVPNNVFRKPFYEEHYGGIQSEDWSKVYFFGIIDIFTNYGATKKVEYIVKSVSQGNGISCKTPDEYSNRFINFVEKILISDDIYKNTNNIDEENKKRNTNHNDIKKDINNIDNNENSEEDY